MSGKFHCVIETSIQLLEYLNLTRDWFEEKESREQEGISSCNEM